MDRSTTEEKGKGKKNESSVHMEYKSIVVGIVAGGPSVSMTDGTMTARNMVGGASVNITKVNGSARNVTGGAFVNMGRINSTARNMVVACCARPHIVLPVKVRV